MMKKHYAAGNRNRGVKFCAGDYISFIDADDTSNSNRIQKISDIINKYQPIYIVHSFSKPNRPDVFKYLFDLVKPNQRTLFMGNEIYYYAFLNKRTKSNVIRLKKHYGKIHHGHPTVKREVFNNILYNETEKYIRGQDALFLRDLLKFYGSHDKTIIFTSEKLSVYTPSRKQSYLYTLEISLKLLCC